MRKNPKAAGLCFPQSPGAVDLSSACSRPRHGFRFLLFPGMWSRETARVKTAGDATVSSVLPWKPVAHPPETQTSTGATDETFCTCMFGFRRFFYWKASVRLLVFVRLLLLFLFFFSAVPTLLDVNGGRVDKRTSTFQGEKSANQRKSVAASISDEMSEKVTLANNVCTSVFLVTNVSVSRPDRNPTPNRPQQQNQTRFSLRIRPEQGGQTFRPV